MKQYFLLAEAIYRDILMMLDVLLFKLKSPPPRFESLIIMVISFKFYLILNYTR